MPPENWIGLGLLAAVVALEVVFSYLAKRFNSWNNDFYNSIQEKNFGDFIYYMKIFTVLAFFHILIFGL